MIYILIEWSYVDRKHFEKFKVYSYPNFFTSVKGSAGRIRRPAIIFDIPNMVTQLIGDAESTKPPDHEMTGLQDMLTRSRCGNAAGMDKDCNRC